MKILSTRGMVACAMVAALYTALCLALSPFSYGMVQIRVAEAFAILPAFSPIAIWGITLGCAISNYIGFISGMNPLGAIDVFIGTAATLIAAVMSYFLRKIKLWGVPVLSSIPPVLVNAVVLGLEFTFLETGGFNAAVFAMNVLYIAAGQAAACIGLGLTLAWALEKTGAAKICFGQTLNAARR